MKLFLLGFLPALIYGYSCPSDTGLFRDPEDCSKFYQCDRGQVHHMDCLGGTVFNWKSKNCDWPDNVDCTTGPTSGPTPGPVPTPGVYVWQTVEKGVKFDHNLDEVPLEIKSNTAKGTPGKYVWIQGTIAVPISGTGVFMLAIAIEDNSAWVGFCNGAGEAFFEPEPASTEVVWTVFKTSKEMVIECNGEFCLKYKYSDSILGDNKCTTFNQPSIQMFFTDLDVQVAEQYRASDWKAAKLKESVSFDIESTPLQLRTWADKDNSQLWIKFFDVSEVFSMSFKFNQFSIWLNPNCNTGYGVEGFTMTNVPPHFYRTWTIFKTPTHLKIECNKVEVSSFEFRSISDNCHAAFTRDSSYLMFDSSGPPSPTIFYRPSVTCETPTFPNTDLYPEYPPIPGSTLEVSCRSGHVNAGSHTITCLEGGTWGWEEQPSCQEIVDGGWSDYEDWSACSVECGEGTRTRSRTCTNPAPSNGGTDCVGDAQETENCNTDPCPVDGGWSDYEDWSDCSLECGEGTRTRSRSCTNPAPSNDGAQCEGDAQETENCNTDPCPEQYCEELNVENGTVSPSGRQTEGTVVTVTCLKPKRNVLMGSKQVTCLASGSWSKTPECRKCDGRILKTMQIL